MQRRKFLALGAGAAVSGLLPAPLLAAAARSIPVYSFKDIKGFYKPETELSGVKVTYTAVPELTEMDAFKADLVVALQGILKTGNRIPYSAAVKMAQSMWEERFPGQPLTVSVSSR